MGVTLQHTHQQEQRTASISIALQDMFAVNGFASSLLKLTLSKVHLPPLPFSLLGCERAPQATHTHLLRLLKCSIARVAASAESLQQQLQLVVAFLRHCKTAGNSSSRSEPAACILHVSESPGGASFAH